MSDCNIRPENRKPGQELAHQTAARRPLLLPTPAARAPIGAVFFGCGAFAALHVCHVAAIYHHALWSALLMLVAIMAVIQHRWIDRRL